MTPTESRAPILSNRRKGWQRFRRNPTALAGLITLTLIVLYVIVGSQIYTQDDANDTNLRLRWAAPSREHPFGSDSVGRDVLARTIYGGQVSLAIAAAAVTVMIGIGVPLGLIAGYFGGWVDRVIMRGVDALLSIPLLFLALVLSRVLQDRVPDLRLGGQIVSGSVVVMVLIIGFTGWMALARIIRANTLTLRERDYVLGARALGAKHWRIIAVHILPNTLTPVIVFATLGISSAIILESYISFLGLGVQPPTPSWGNMLQRATEKIDTAPWLWFYPGSLTLLTVLSVNFIGDGLRDALDPSS